MTGEIVVAGDIHALCRGLEICTLTGRYILVDIDYETGIITIRRSTWWRRLYWRARRLFT